MVHTSAGELSRASAVAVTHPHNQTVWFLFPFFFAAFHLTDQARRHGPLKKKGTRLAHCVRTRLRTCSFHHRPPPSLPAPPASFIAGNPTPLFHRSGPTSHLALPAPPKKLRGPSTPSPATTAPVKLRPPALTCVAGLTGAFVAVDFVDAPAVVAGFALAVVQVDLAVETCELGHTLSNTAEK